MNELDIKSEVWSTVRTLNRAWAVERDTNGLRRFFHPTMVAITPMDRLVLEGRDACIASWKAFVDKARVARWEESDPTIHLYAEGRCAAVAYYYDLTCEVGSQKLQLSGRDLLTLVKEEGRWWVVADQFSPFPKKDVENAVA